MKKIVILSVLFVFAICSLAYAGQFGPPEPTTKEGKVAIGVGYFHSSAKLKPKDTKNWKEERISQNQTYLQLSYGIMKGWEVYLRAGGADLKAKNLIDDPTVTRVGPKDFKDGFKPFSTLGAKGIIYENNNKSLSIGPFIQTTLYSNYKDEWTRNELGWSDSGSITAKWEKPWDVNLGISAQTKIGEVILYGGPFVYWYKVKGVNEAMGSAGSNSDSTTFKEKNNIGGFAGVKVPLGKKFSVEVEGQMKSKFSAGAAIIYRF
jgi:hypothetical protein